jgi:hypothetical protein
LSQRDRILGASRKIADTHIDPILWTGGLVTLKLFLEERKQVSWMKAVTNLRATAIEADIFQGLLFLPGTDPKGEDSLIGSTELACACQNTAAVDPNRKLESLGVLQRKKFRASLRGSVEGCRGRCGEEFGNPFFGQSDFRAKGFGAKGSLDRLNGQGSEGRDGVDAACAHKDESRTVLLAKLQHLNGSDQIVIQQIEVGHLPARSCQDTGFGGTVDDPIDLWNFGKI